MRKQTTLLPMLSILALVLAIPLLSHAQNREKFVISARAGGVNTVTGGASMKPHGNAEWKQLTIKEDLETGDVVKTDLDGRVEVLLNPGSYMRIAENSEVELANNSLDNLEVRLNRGTAIVEVTGAEDEDLFIGITTPHTRISIIRRGLYRLNVIPGDTTELIVRKGRVMLEDSHTKVKAGNKVVFSGSSFSVAKLTDAEKNDRDPFGSWSKTRAQSLAKANTQISRRTLSAFASSFRDDWYLMNRRGFWLFSAGNRCYTFIPFSAPYAPYSSPYGGNYSGSLWAYSGCRACQRSWLGGGRGFGRSGASGTSGALGPTGGGSPMGSPSVGSSGRGGISESPMSSMGKPDINPGGAAPGMRPPKE